MILKDLRGWRTGADLSSEEGPPPRFLDKMHV
jgi:hypothetical protein